MDVISTHNLATHHPGEQFEVHFNRVFALLEGKYTVDLEFFLNGMGWLVRTEPFASHILYRGSAGVVAYFPPFGWMDAFSAAVMSAAIKVHLSYLNIGEPLLGDGEDGFILPFLFAYMTRIGDLNLPPSWDDPTWNKSQDFFPDTLKTEHLYSKGYKAGSLVQHPYVLSVEDSATALSLTGGKVSNLDRSFPCSQCDKPLDYHQPHYGIDLSLNGTPTVSELLEFALKALNSPFQVSGLAVSTEVTEKLEKLGLPVSKQFGMWG